MIWTEGLIVLGLVFLNGLLNMAEMALVSSRPQRLQAMVEAEVRGAAVALALITDQGRLLSTVQAGITLLSLLTGAVSGAALSAPLAELLKPVPQLAPIADGLAFALVVLGTGYVSLIAGELVPKQLGLRHAENLAIWVARPVRILSLIMHPVVLLLDRSSRIILGLFSERQAQDEELTEEEVKILIDEGTKAGIFEKGEQDMFGRVMRFADRAVASLMTPRIDIEWLEVDLELDQLITKIRDGGHSRYPVGAGDLTEIQGVIYARDLMSPALQAACEGKQRLDLTPYLKPLPAIHETTPALKALDLMRMAASHVALVVDEYGQVEGLVTVTDVLEALVGELPEAGRDEASSAVHRADGSWLLDGTLPIEEVKHILDIDELPDEDQYDTLGGFLMTSLGAVPQQGQAVAHEAFRFEVVDMDGRRVDKVLVERLSE
jgi:putative hemolysin